MVGSASEPRSRHRVNRLEEEARIGKAGALAAQLSRLEVVVLDELGYLPFARSGRTGSG